MLRRTHVEPFLEEQDGRLHVVPLEEDAEGRVLAFLDRLLRLLRRLEGRPLHVVQEALRRQERRVRDARRLGGIAKTLLDACRFRAPAGAERAPEVRAALFASRGKLWPPTPGDEREPFRRAAAALGLEEVEVDRLLRADDPRERVLVRAPRFTPAGLLARYDQGLAAAVLLDAESVTIRARGGWGDLLRTVKLARLMYRLERRGRRTYELEVTGPAAAFVTRARRYGTRFARLVAPALRAPGGRLEAVVHRDGRRLPYRVEARAWPGAATRKRRRRYDSSWEEGLARDFADKLGEARRGWTIQREGTPVPVGPELFLPDFTFRHRDGREALVEIVGFWTPEYLEAKLRKVEEAGLPNLVLVVYRALAAGRASEVEAEAAGGTGAVLTFARKPLIGAVMAAVERVAVPPGTAAS